MLLVIAIESFFCDLMSDVWVFIFQISSPFLIENALSVSSKSITKNLSLYILISELNGAELFLDHNIFPVSISSA